MASFQGIFTCGYQEDQHRNRIVRLFACALAVLLISSICYSVVTLAAPVSTPAPDEHSVSVTGSFWGSQQSPMAVEPGTINNPFTVYLSNFGLIPAKDITISLNLSYPFSSFEDPENISNSMRELPPAATLPTTFYLNVAPNSSVGVYILQVQVEFSLSDVSYSFDAEVQLPVTTLANLTVQNAFWGSTLSPTLVGPGTGYASLVLNVKNVGNNNAYNASITVHLSGPFYHDAAGFETDETVQLGVVPAGSVMPAMFTVSVESDISIGEYPMSVTLNYNNGIFRNQIVDVPVLGSPNIVEQSYAIVQGNAYPGDDNVALSIYLVNSGNLTANNVGVQLFVPSPLSPSYLGSDRTTLGVMPPGQPMLVKFLFNIPDSISSPLNLEFVLRISYGGRESTYYIPVTISGMSSFTESTNDSLAFEQGSSDVSISLAITNEGNVTAQFVDAQLLLPNGLSGTTFTFLGNIGPGNSNLAVFALDVSSSAPPGGYHSILRITWLQDGAPGRQFSQDIPLAFQVKQSLLDLVMSSPLTYIAVVCAAAIVVAFVMSRRGK